MACQVGKLSLAGISCHQCRPVLRCSRAAFHSESLPLFSFVNRLFRNLKGSLWKHDLVCSLLLHFLNGHKPVAGRDPRETWNTKENRKPFFSSEAFLHCFFSCLLSLMRQSISVCHLELQGLGHLTDGLRPWIFFSALRC